MTATTSDWRERRDRANEFFLMLSSNTFEPGTPEALGFAALVNRLLLIETEAEYIRFVEFSVQVEREMLLRLSTWGLN